MSQNYGVLRVVRVRPPANAATGLRERYPAGWLPEEHLVYLLTRCETTIGRALNNDLVLMDPSVSREHARLVLDERGWRIYNLTARNIVRVNGQPVPAGESRPILPQDFLVLGSTMLQLIAPQQGIIEPDPGPARLAEHFPPLSQLIVPVITLPSHGASSNGQGKLSDIAREDGTVVVPSHEAGPPGHSLTPPGLAPDPEMAAQPWEQEEESLLGAGVTMQFALPQRMGKRTRWLIAGIGIAIVIVSAIITVILNSLIGLAALTQGGPSSLLAALTIPLIPALSINLLVNFIDRYEREPWFLRLAAFLWGAIIAIPPALLIEQNIDGMLQNALGPDASNIVRSALQGLNAGVTEETIKGLGLLLLFFVLRDEFDNVTDGIVYGALIGAGFAMVENFVYFANNARDALPFLIVVRVVLGWLCHSTFTACFGVSLGYIRHTRVRWQHIVIPLIGYLCAVGLHSVFDFITFFVKDLVLAAPGNAMVARLSLIAVIGDYIPPFIAQLILLYLLIKALAHEAAVIREFLASEVGSGVVQVDEYALLQNSFRRTKVERYVLWKSGFKQWLRVKALYQTEIGLAFRKWHVSMGDKPKLGYLQPEDAYRQRIGRLRQEIAGAEKSKKV
ncbi:MAG TPA: PrsW family glutamic-type intramembrane protease [Ktedonosporobacter sp.]|jgi:RsiW-degrading membrane proteinase PrsW (M82 family)|nr:PrsW family glutamic-type intramembrane protease [Ktedonosporobacter sp.]